MRLTISTEQDELLLQPQRRSTDTTPLLVQVGLEVGQADRSVQRLHSLVVSLQQVENMTFGSRHERNVFTPASVIIDVSTTRLRPGSHHSWHVRLDVPHTSLPHSAIFGSSISSTAHVHAVVRYPVHLLGVHTSITRAKHARRPIQVVHQPGGGSGGVDADADPYCYTHTQTGAHGRGLGPVIVQLTAQHLTVGGMMRVHAALPAPAPGKDVFRLKSVEFAIQQSVRLRSRRCVEVRARIKMKGKDGKEAKVHARREVVVMPARRLVLFHRETEVLESDGYVLRLPPCSMMRPSSISDGPGIHVSHLFTARFAYSMLESDPTCSTSATTSKATAAPDCDGDDGKRTAVTTTAPQRKSYAYTLAWGIHIPSCALAWESVILPVYQERDPHPPPPLRNADTGADMETIQDPSNEQVRISSRRSKAKVKAKERTPRRCVCSQDRAALLALGEDMAALHAVPAERRYRMLDVIPHGLLGIDSSLPSVATSASASTPGARAGTGYNTRKT